MNTERKERRRFERIFFSEDDEIRGTFQLPEHHNMSMAAKIMDICEDGMCLDLKEYDESDTLNDEDHLIFTEIRGTEDLHFLVNIELEIRWTLNLKHFAIGCEFVNLSPSIREQIRQMMNSWENE